MKALFKNLFLSFSSPAAAPLSEKDRLLADLEETRQQMDYAWKRLDYAAPEYVEIAVLELLLVETQYGLLNKRYRLMLGLNESSHHPNHAFYRTRLNAMTEHSPLVTSASQSMSSNSYHA